MSEGQAFAWTPAGPMPIEADGTPMGGSTVNPAGMVAANARPQQTVALAVPHGSTAVPLTQAEREWGVKLTDLVRPGNLIKAAKARIRDIRAELRNKKRLERELAELERLVAAAKKPLAAVRPIDSARHAR